jgi:cell fate regulator YaaT (PSP1 superfamily)
MVGGVGPCGQVVCCAKFLGEFAPVSIKMAKEQSLSLNPTKISGLCGRLMCCLKYEQDTYEELLKTMPSVGAIVMTPQGKGVIIDTYTLLQRVKAKVRLKDGTEDIFQFQADEIKATGKFDPAYQRYGDKHDDELLEDFRSLE